MGKTFREKRGPQIRKPPKGLSVERKIMVVVIPPDEFCGETDTMACKFVSTTIPPYTEEGKMKLPEKMRIGYRNYIVRNWEKQEADARNLRGTHWSHAGWIKIDESLCPEEKANTFIHEILHAIWLQCDLDDDLEEHVVTVLANQLTQVFQDNPEVTKYLRSALAKKPVSE